MSFRSSGVAANIDEASAMERTGNRSALPAFAISRQMVRQPFGSTGGTGFSGGAGSGVSCGGLTKTVLRPCNRGAGACPDVRGAADVVGQFQAGHYVTGTRRRNRVSFRRGFFDTWIETENCLVVPRAESCQCRCRRALGRPAMGGRI
jgi:hypothetical protein